jgi:hypothetical protein
MSTFPENRAGAAPAPEPPGRAPAPDDRPGSTPSLGELLSDISADLSSLFQQEVALAKAEIRESTQRAARGSGMLAGAAVGAHFVLLFLSVALWWGLGSAMGRGWSALVVAAVWAVVAAVLALRGRVELRKVRGLPETTDTVKKIPHALQGHEEMNS